MGLSNSLYASISGLSTMGNAMSVLGDNVANVNTIAFKSSRATFQDVLSQSIATAAGSAQVGRGVTLSTVDGLFAQGSFETTSTATDLAIGGQGFFMLRAADSAQADMYTRAGEFRFDTEGYLVSPIGHYVQGWTINSTSGEIEGTIGDIQIGKSTPPVATTQVDVIVNVDSRKANETTETRLYEAWNGTNAAAAVPTDPIDSTSFEYTTAIKIYDSKGAAHDLTAYFDRTTQDNEWEFLVTCEPSEDKRVLSDGLDANGNPDGTNDEQTIYAPDTRYNYQNHKGAGALLYGVVDFSTSGDIDKIYAWRVPPDGKVDPASNTNRIVLGQTDKYYSFDVNFTGATSNSSVELNLGATYSGQTTDIPQILVSDGGAYADSGQNNAITKETLWTSVYDASGNQMQVGDSFYFTGYDHDGNYVSGGYVIQTGDKVQALLTALNNTFNATATVDASGRIRLTDKTGGDSGMYLTNFKSVTATAGTSPFGGTSITSASVPAASSANVATAYLQDATGNRVTNPASTLVGLQDGNGSALAAGDTISFSGVDIAGNSIAAASTITVTATTTVQDVLNRVADLFDDGTVNSSYLNDRTVSAVLNDRGQIMVFDNTNSGNLVVRASYSNAAYDHFGNNNVNYTSQGVVSTKLNITTSKQEVVSLGRAVRTASSAQAINADTDWDSVYDGSGTVVDTTTPDTIVFSGTDVSGNNVVATFTVGTDYGPPLSTPTGTVRDLLSWLEDKFSAEASIDGAGRLVLTDRTADSAATGGHSSSLAINKVTYSGAEIFGTYAFETISSDLTSEDGSRMGDTVSIDFNTEALASTQYANSSTTIFQDQDGFAAGFLQSVSVDTDGVITGNYSNGQVLKKAQVALASFNNTSGLRKEGGNIFRETTDSGAPVTGAPGTNGLGAIAPNSLEQSNVDLGTEFVKLITTQRGFQANSKIITTTDEMLADLINIKR